MRTSSAKAKGRELQKHVAKQIQDKLHLPEEDVVSRPMGSGGCDLMMSHKARSVLPISFEIKNTKLFPSLSALRQSRANCNTDHDIPAVCWKPPGKAKDETIIYFNLEEFLDWWKEHVNS